MQNFPTNEDEEEHESRMLLYHWSIGESKPGKLLNNAQ